MRTGSAKPEISPGRPETRPGQHPEGRKIDLQSPAEVESPQLPPRGEKRQEQTIQPLRFALLQKKRASP